MGTELEHNLEKISELSGRALGYAEEVEKKRKAGDKHAFLYTDLWWVRYHLEEIQSLSERAKTDETE